MTRKISIVKQINDGDATAINISDSVKCNALSDGVNYLPGKTSVVNVPNTSKPEPTESPKQNGKQASLHKLIYIIYPHRIAYVIHKMSQIVCNFINIW